MKRFPLLIALLFSATLLIAWAGPGDPGSLEVTNRDGESLHLGDAGTSIVNGVYLPNGTANGYPKYQKDNSIFVYKVANGRWYISMVDGSEVESDVYYYSRPASTVDFVTDGRVFLDWVGWANGANPAPERWLDGFGQDVILVNDEVSSYVNEDDEGSRNLTVLMPSPSSNDVTVNLSYAGTATGGGVDYTAPASVIIPAGQKTATVTITAVDDAIEDTDETIDVSIGSVTNGTFQAPNTQTLTIYDDDAPFPTVLIASGAAVGGTGVTVNGTYTQVGTRNGVPEYYRPDPGIYLFMDADEFWYFNTEDGDYDAGRSLYSTDDNFRRPYLEDDPAPDNWVPGDVSPGAPGPTMSIGATPPPAPVLVECLINGSFELPAENDYIGSPSEDTVPGWMTVNFDYFEYWQVPLAPSVPDGVQVIELYSGGQETIYQDFQTTPGEVLSYSFYHRQRDSAQELANVAFGAPGATTVVGTTEGSTTSAWTEFTGTYTVPSGQTLTRFEIQGAVASVNYSGTGGNLIDAVSVQGTSCPPPAAASPTIWFTTSSSSLDGMPEGSFGEEEGTMTLSATVLDNEPVVSDVTVDFTFADVTATRGEVYDYSAPMSVTIPAGEYYAELVVSLFDDDVYEGDETFTVQMGSGSGYDVDDDTPQTITIVDDETSPVISLAATPLTVIEGNKKGGTVELTVSLSGKSASVTGVELNYGGTATKSDFTGAGVIKIGAGALSAVTTLQIVGDLLDEPDETIVVALASPRGGTISPDASLNTQTITITDDDDAPVATLTLDPPGKDEGLRIFTIDENGGETTGKVKVIATLDAPSGFNIQIPLTFPDLQEGGLTLAVPVVECGASKNCSPGAGDYSISQNFIYIPAGQTAGAVTILAIDNADYAGDRNAYVVVGSPLSNVTAKASPDDRVTVTVKEDEAFPLSANTYSQVIQENATLVIDLLTIAAGATSVTEVTNPNNGGTATLDVATGKVTYTPKANYVGTEKFSYTASGGGQNRSGDVYITITAVPDNPVAVDVALTGSDYKEDTPFQVALTEMATDPDVGDVLTFTFESQPANATVTVDGNVIKVVPTANANGADQFTFSAKDQTGLASETKTVSWTLAAVYDTPTFANGSTFDVELGKSRALNINDILNGVDGPSTVYRIYAITSPDPGPKPWVAGIDVTMKTTNGNGLVMDKDQKTLTYTASSDFEGSEEVTAIVVNTLPGPFVLNDINNPLKSFGADFVTLTFKVVSPSTVVALTAPDGDPAQYPIYRTDGGTGSPNTRTYALDAGSAVGLETTVVLESTGSAVLGTDFRITDMNGAETTTFKIAAGSKSASFKILALPGTESRVIGLSIKSVTPGSASTTAKTLTIPLVAGKAPTVEIAESNSSSTSIHEGGPLTDGGAGTSLKWVGLRLADGATAAADIPVTVSFSGATQGVDFEVRYHKNRVEGSVGVLSNGSMFEIGKGLKDAWLEIRALDDEMYEGDETLMITIVSAVGAQPAMSFTSLAIKIVDNDVASIETFDDYVSVQMELQCPDCPFPTPDIGEVVIDPADLLANDSQAGRSVNMLQVTSLTRGTDRSSSVDVDIVIGKEGSTYRVRVERGPGGEFGTPVLDYRVIGTEGAATFPFNGTEADKSAWYTANAELWATGHVVIEEGVRSNRATVSVTQTGAYQNQPIQLESPLNTTLEAVQSTTNPSPKPLPAGVESPVGFLRFNITNVQNGAARVAVTLPPGATVSEYWKYGPRVGANVECPAAAASAANSACEKGKEANWYKWDYDEAKGYGARQESIPGGKVLALYFKDGQLGDFDMEVNGVIVDPGVPVFTTNVAPVVVLDSAVVVEDNAVDIDFLTNDSDADGDALVYAITTDPANGTWSDNGDGTGTYTPNADFFGTDSFTYTIDDGYANAEVGTVTIEVTGTPDLPIAIDDAATTASGVKVSVNVFANDYDPDGDEPFYLSAISNPANGVAAFMSDGTVTYTPNTGFVGQDTITYSITDGVSGIFAQATVSITVTGTAAGPVASADVSTTAEETAVNVDVLANDINPQGNALAVASFTQGANGTVTAGEGGTLVYTPAADFNGTDTFTYTVTDGGVTSGAVTVTISVTAVNDAPVFETGAAISGTEGGVVIGGAVHPEASEAQYQVTFSGTASDVDDAELTYSYQLASRTDFTEVLLTAPASAEGASIPWTDILDALAAANMVPGAEITIAQRMVVTDTGGLSARTEAQEITFIRGFITANGEIGELPTEYFLDGNYPNPFNPVTTIRFGLPASGDVSVVVYDLMGRQVAMLVAGTLPAGVHEVRFDASNLPSGAYIYRLATPAGQYVKTMMLLK
ncbi:MAG: Ig-like domain-containing protein [Rhodothermales bacterium]